MGLGTLVSWAVFGLFVGIVARIVWFGRSPVGCLPTMLLGIAGSVVGGMITHALTGGGYQPASYLMSLLGAIVVLWIYGATVTRPRDD
jgi:uncharacterized membrane protein YeaQ/YmgE (transglycosylase-associated protein family)